MAERPRVLVIAEAANPEWVSVPLIGWSLTEALRGVADVHLVTQVRNREAILRAGWIEGVDFTSIDTEAIARPAHKLATWLRMGENKGWTIVQAINSLTYPYFERRVWKEFGPRIRAGEFDIVHRVTPLSPTANSSLAAKCRTHGVPFVMGPLNGGVPWPKEFRSAQRKEREWLSSVRSLFKVNPARWRTLSNAAAILVGSKFTGSEVPDRFAEKLVYIPENAIDPSRFARTHQPWRGGALRGCFIGRLVPYKGADMLIEAAAPLLQAGQLELDILGDGPEKAPLEALAGRLGVSDAVRFHGWVDHRQVQDVAARNQMLIFPSIREFGGGVVIEAMAMGLVPVICDYAGPGELVDDTTGFKIPMGQRSDIIGRLQSCLERICGKPDMLEDKARAAQDRVKEKLTWPAKAAQIADVYQWVLRDGPRPAPFGDVARQGGAA